MPPVGNESDIKALINEAIKKNHVTIFAKTTCPYCKKVKEFFTSLNVKYYHLDLDLMDNGSQIQDALFELTGQKTVPNVFIGGQHIGGNSETQKLHAEGRLMPLLHPQSAESDSKAFVTDAIKKSHVTVFAKTTCPYCKKVKELLTSLSIKYTSIDLDLMDNGSQIQDALFELTGQKTVPNVFIGGQHIGGNSETQKLHSEGRLLPLVSQGAEPEEKYEYDFVVIGGGSGGLASAKEAASLGAKVACVDFIKPSLRGSTWGLGGTCVNVGCIPKKLMHQAALLRHGMEDAQHFGWTVSDATHNWVQMKSNIQDYIKSLNFNYRVQLQQKEIKYFNAYAEFVGPHTIKVTNKKGTSEEVTSKYFLVATGGRPTYPTTPGVKEYAITSDDLFSLPYAPGKTLVVGASYVALECAGFLAGLGFDVTVLVRSILLRGFDQQMAEVVGQYMATHNVKFIRPCTVEKVERLQEGSPGLYRVTSKMADSGEEIVGEYNTILYAIGRQPCTADLKLDSVGVKLSKSGHIIADDYDRTSAQSIFAIGDVAEGRPELTPTAIQAGILLAKRLFGTASARMDYINVPTTVFTPLEYGAIGLSEEAAIEKYGEEDVEVYHQNLWPLEWTVPHREDNVCYAKLVCVKSLNERVVGFHYAGPNAGEVTQGFTVGMRMGATKYDFNGSVGIHPTCAEVFTTLKVTKRSAQSVAQGGC